MSRNNLNVFNHGVAIAKKAIQKQLRTLWIDIAKDALYDAVQSWSGYNMTGNTANSYACAVYEKGKILHFFSAYDVGVQDKPTAPYSYPGDFVYFWHQRTLNENLSDYAESENNSMGVVENYRSRKLSFQPVGRGRGDEDAKQFLNNYKASKELEIVVIVGVPYAEYLENVRKLEVLQDNFENIGSIANANIASVKELKL